MLLLGDHRHQSRHSDAVGAHGRAHRFAVLTEDVDGERIGVLAAQLEDVADLDAARTHQWAGPVRGGVAVANLGGFDDPVRDEVPSGHQADHMLARFVGPGDPCRTAGYPRIH